MSFTSERQSSLMALDSSLLRGVIFIKLLGLNLTFLLEFLSEYRKQNSSMFETSTTEYHKNLFWGLYCFYQVVDCGLYLGTGDPCLVYQDKMTKNKVKAQRKFMIGLLITNSMH